MDAATLARLRSQSERWAETYLPTSGIHHRPPILSAYVAFLLREHDPSSRRPRAYFSPTEQERRRKYARAVAPWDSTEHHYNGPPKVPDARLSLRRALLKQYPKEGDVSTRRRALETLRYGFVVAVEEGQILHPETISHSEVGRLALYLPKHAERLCEAS